MSAPKLLHIMGMAGKVEASYNAGGVLAPATDAILLAEPFEATIGYAHDGDRGNWPGTAGARKRLRPSGRFLEGSAKIEGRGAGVAYSASVTPPDVHAWLRAAGHSATFSVNKWTYAPQSSNDGTAFASMVADFYARGQKYSATGIYADFGFTIDGPDALVFDFPFSGLVSLPTDAAVPVLTYSNVDPPKCESIGFALGAWITAVVRKVAFKANRGRSPRVNVNAAGHAGFSQGRRRAELVVTVEAVPLSSFNVYSRRDLGTLTSVALTINGGPNNKITFTAPQAQIIDVVDGADEEVATWDLTLVCHTSTPTADDDYWVEFGA